MGKKEKGQWRGMGRPSDLSRVGSLLDQLQGKQTPTQTTPEDAEFVPDAVKSHENEPYAQWLSEIDCVAHVTEGENTPNRWGIKNFEAEIEGKHISDVHVKVYRNAKSAGSSRTTHMNIHGKGYDEWRLSQRMVFVWSKDPDLFKQFVSDQIEEIDRHAAWRTQGKKK